MKKIVYIFLTICFLCSVSCSDEIEINDEHQAVLNMYFYVNYNFPHSITPPKDDFIIAEIYQTLDLVDTILSHQRVNNARIEIYSDNELIALLEPQDEKNLFVDYEPIEGKTYQVYGYADGYPVITGECTIPVTVPINYIESRLDTINNILECTLNFTDPPNSVNYYNLTCSSSITCNDPIINNNYYYSFSDELINGKNYNLHFDIKYFSNQMEDIIVNLHSISESYYYSTVTSQLYNEANDDIYSEPVQYYSNVKNGLGQITACCTASDTIYLSKK